MAIENLDGSSRKGTAEWNSLLDLSNDANSLSGKVQRNPTTAEKNAVGAILELPQLTIESSFAMAGVNGDNAAQKPPATTDVVVADPITETDLKAKYEQVKLTTVDGKQEVRFLEKGHPEKGAFKVIEALRLLMAAKSPLVPSSQSAPLMMARNSDLRTLRARSGRSLLKAHT